MVRGVGSHVGVAELTENRKITRKMYVRSLPLAVP